MKNQFVYFIPPVQFYPWPSKWLFCCSVDWVLISQLSFNIIHRWPLINEGRYHPRKKIHTIRLVFHHHLGVQNMQNWGKRIHMFLAMFINIGQNMMDINQERTWKKTCIKGLLARLETPFTRMIVSVSLPNIYYCFLVPLYVIIISSM